MDSRLSIRHLTQADIDAAGDILAAAYDSPAGGRAATLRRYLALQPDGWLLAVLDGRPVGVGGAVNYGPFASIGSVGVRPEAQRLGIGRALMERLLSWLEEVGCPVAVLTATEAGAPLYRALGFVEDGATLVSRRDEATTPLSEAAVPRPHRRPTDMDMATGGQDAPVDALSPRVTAPRREDLPALVRFDAPIFGAARPAVLASYLADAPGRAFVARDDAGDIGGYLIAQEVTLGPWAARTPADAEALLARALALPFAGPARAIVPSANGEVATNGEAVRLLRRHGFGEPFALRRMRRGGDATPGDPARIYGQASFAIG